MCVCISICIQYAYIYIYICIVECYSAIKKNEILPCAATGMDLGEVSQTEIHM